MKNHHQGVVVFHWLGWHEFNMPAGARSEDSFAEKGAARYPVEPAKQIIFLILG